MKECYVIYLWGYNVFSTVSLQKVITDADKIDDVVSDIATKYELEFVLESDTNTYKRYRNITDDRDISIIVKQMQLE